MLLFHGADYFLKLSPFSGVYKKCTLSCKNKSFQTHLPLIILVPSLKILVHTNPVFGSKTSLDVNEINYTQKGMKSCHEIEQKSTKTWI